MKALADQLRGVQDYVLTGDRAGITTVVGSRRFTRPERLRIYREGYYLRLAEALSTTFPSLRAMLGVDQFRFLVRDYVDAHPSRHFSVRRYGHRLARWLRVTTPYSDQPVLGEIADWEWAMAHAFDAADDEPIKNNALAGLHPARWPSVRFEFHDSLCLVSTRWNSVALWRTLSREEAPPAPVREAPMVRWAIWRQGLKIFFDRMDEAERRALGLARRGRTFAEICASAPESAVPNAQAAWCADLLRRWATRGWITRLAHD